MFRKSPRLASLQLFVEQPSAFFVIDPKSEFVCTHAYIVTTENGHIFFATIRN